MIRDSFLFDASPVTFDMRPGTVFIMRTRLVVDIRSNVFSYSVQRSLFDEQGNKEKHSCYSRRRVIRSSSVAETFLQAAVKGERMAW